MSGVFSEEWVSRDATEKLCSVEIQQPEMCFLQCLGERQGLLVVTGRTDDGEALVAAGIKIAKEYELFALAWRVALLGFQATYQRAIPAFLKEWHRKTSIFRTQKYIRQFLESRGKHV